ncbi:MAG: dihydrolipoyl dehydrogenase [Clostridiaceae bacterium]
MEKDLVVIGGGPGGYEAAIRAAQLGMKVCVVEKDKLGGTCTNRGCIPTKALYRHAEILNILHEIDEFGITVSSYDMNVTTMQERKNKVVDQLRQGIEGLMKANDIEVIKGTGFIADSNTVKVLEENGLESVVKTKNIIIATGSIPAVPSFPGADTEGIYFSEDILNFTKIPEDLTIIGGGVIGMEFAGIFNAMGTKVTVVEFLPNILAQVDTDLTKRLLPMLKKKNMSINTSTKVVSIDKQGGRFVVICEGKKGPVSFESEAVLISTGRKPAIDQKRFEELGIEFTRQGITVDENYETSLKGVYAVGDVNGKWMLAHAASHQGIQVAEHLAGMSHGESGKVIPGCIFIFPEISVAGLSEDEAKAKGIDYVTAKFMFGANGKALALGEPEGLVKVIANKTDKTIIGVHIMGPHASDLIHEGVVAIEKKLTVDDIAHIVHAHPTLSEAFVEAVLGLEGKSIHSYPPKK